MVWWSEVLLVNCIPQNLDNPERMLASIREKSKALVGGLTAALKN